MSDADGMEHRFTSLEHAAWTGFLVTYARVYRRVEDDLLEHARLTHVEFEALLRLSFAPERRLRMQELAARSVLTRSGVSRAVERLERAGLVRREQASEDRRGAWVVLTPSGDERFRAIAGHHMRTVRDTFLAPFSPDELERMAEGWRRIQAGLDETSRDAPPSTGTE